MELVVLSRWAQRYFSSCQELCCICAKIDSRLGIHLARTSVVFFLLLFFILLLIVGILFWLFAIFLGWLAMFCLLLLNL